ncbi:MAG TPA: hypothetical protein VMU43_01025 [Candidatus Acidoferrum sp.]|nr:hypothetical protein [Candidatus Acidoferrum sp.]
MFTQKHRLEKQCALFLAILAAVMVSGAKSTKLAFTWKNPNYAGPSFKNVLVLAMNGRASSRADFEDRLVAAIARPGIQAVPSYSLLPRPESTPINMDQMRDVVQGQGFDAIVVSSLVKYKKTVTYVPGQTYPLNPYYGTFYGYYGALSPVVYSPGYLQTDTAAQVETNFYSTAKPDGELVWTGTSNTVNPRSVTKAIDGIVKVVVQALEKENLI